jgi:hypothetical protein
VEELQLQSNELAGRIPSQLGSLHRLKELHLESNKLTGQVPSHIGLLKLLKNMYVYENQLMGAMPAEICGLAKDEQLGSLQADCTSGDIQCFCCTKCF